MKFDGKILIIAVIIFTVIIAGCTTAPNEEAQPANVKIDAVVKLWLSYSLLWS